MLDAHKSASMCAGGSSSPRRCHAAAAAASGIRAAIVDVLEKSITGRGERKHVGPIIHVVPARRTCLISPGTHVRRERGGRVAWPPGGHAAFS